jgi:hypothetical protein
MVFFAHCILSRIEIKDLKFFHVVLIFTEVGQDLTHTENAQSEIFLSGRLKIFTAFSSLRALI